MKQILVFYLLYMVQPLHAQDLPGCISFKHSPTVVATPVAVTICPCENKNKNKCDSVIYYFSTDTFMVDLSKFKRLQLFIVNNRLLKADLERLRIDEDFYAVTDSIGKTRFLYTRNYTKFFHNFSQFIRRNSLNKQIINLFE